MKNFRDYVVSTSNKKEIGIDNVTNQLLSPTGFMYHDYMNGVNITVYDDDEIPIERFHNIGLLHGSVNTLISKSNVGKTTLALGFAKGIIEPWIKDPLLKTFINPEMNPKTPLEKTGLIQFIDAEKTFDLSNAKRITKYPNHILKNHLEINQISTDKELVRCIEKHVKFKTDTMKKLYMPIRDIYGDKILSYPPTCCIIDSFNKINPEDTEGLGEKEYDKSTNNTAGARRARIISAIYSSLVNYAKYYNIIFICINHINTAPNMSFLPQPKQYHGLKVGETISGGERAIYLASNIGRMDKDGTIGGEKGKYSFGEGIEGSVVKYTNIKSKTNKFGANCKLVYLNHLGYDPLYSTVWEAMCNGDLVQTGNSYVLDAFPNVKFNIRNFREKFSDNLPLLHAFYSQVRDKASVLLSGSIEDAMKADKKLSKEILGNNDELFGVNNELANELTEIYNEIYSKVSLGKWNGIQEIEKTNRRILKRIS